MSKKNKLYQILSPNKNDEGVWIHQNAWFHIGKYDSKSKDEYSLNDKENGKAIVVAGGNGDGANLNQLHNPRGIFVDKNNNLYIADSDNYRIVKWEPDAENGVVVAGGNGGGSNLNQLAFPSGVAVDSNGNIYIRHRKFKNC